LLTGSERTRGELARNIGNARTAAGAQLNAKSLKTAAKLAERKKKPTPVTCTQAIDAAVGEVRGVVAGIER
jgi:hypothetical protein